MMNDSMFFQVMEILKQVRKLHAEDFEKDVRHCIPWNIAPFTKEMIGFFIGCCHAQWKWIKNYQHPSLPPPVSITNWFGGVDRRQLSYHQIINRGICAVGIGLVFRKITWQQAIPVLHYLFNHQAYKDDQNMHNYLLQYLCQHNFMEGVLGMNQEFTRQYQWKTAFVLTCESIHNALPLLQWMWSNFLECRNFDQREKNLLMFHVLNNSKNPHVLNWLVNTVECPHEMISEELNQDQMSDLFHAGVNPLLFPKIGVLFLKRQTTIENALIFIFPKDVIQHILLPYCGF